MKKKIKIKFCSYDPKEEISFANFFLERLLPHYDVELSEDPDYVFFYERDNAHLRYPNAIRIFYTGENVHPDWNMTDYAVSFDRLEFGDRHFRLPLYMVATLYNKEDIELAGDLTFEDIKPMTREELHNKKSFCCFSYNNALSDKSRKQIFDALSTYKKVNACGEYLNNMDGWTSRQLSFKQEHKFFIASENSSREGYLTEKLPVGFLARTIPIYFGDPTVGLEFNTKRFINVHEFPSLEAVVERIKEIDQNDDLYLEIVNQPVLAPGFHYQDHLTDFDSFLRNIFDQPKHKARRRSINASHAYLLEKRDLHFFSNQNRATKLRGWLAPLNNIAWLKKLKTFVRQRIIHRL